MALTLAPGDHLAATQDAGTDVAYEINGDLRTIAGSTDAYGSLAQGVLPAATPTSLLGPAAGTDMIVDAMSISNPGASTRIVTFYKTKGGTTYNATTQWGPAITLSPGCSAQWGGDEWTIYNAIGVPILSVPLSAVTPTDVSLTAATAGASGLASDGAHRHVHAVIASGDLHTEYIQETLVAAKGDIIGASANDVPAVTSVGADNAFLRGSSGAAAGLAWTAASAATPALIGGPSAGTPANSPSADNHVHGLALAAGHVANTTITNTVTPTTGGTTFAAPAIAAGHMYRIRAHGQFTAANSATARNSQVNAFWAATALGAILAIVVPASLAQTTQWELEIILTGVDATHIWATGYFHSRLGLAAADSQAQRLATLTNWAPASTVVSAGAQTLDLRFSMSTSVAGDSWVVQQVTMERML